MAQAWFYGARASCRLWFSSGIMWVVLDYTCRSLAITTQLSRQVVHRIVTGSIMWPWCLLTFLSELLGGPVGFVAFSWSRHIIFVAHVSLKGEMFIRLSPREASL